MSECPSGFPGQLLAGTPASCSVHLAPSGPVTNHPADCIQKPPQHIQGLLPPLDSVLCGTGADFGVHGSPDEQRILDADTWPVARDGSYLVGKQHDLCPWLSFAPLPPQEPLSRVWLCPHWLQSSSLEDSPSPSPCPPHSRAMKSLPRAESLLGTFEL